MKRSENPTFRDIDVGHRDSLTQQVLSNDESADFAETMNDNNNIKADRSTSHKKSSLEYTIDFTPSRQAILSMHGCGTHQVAEAHDI